MLGVTQSADMVGPLIGPGGKSKSSQSRGPWLSRFSLTDHSGLSGMQSIGFHAFALSLLTLPQERKRTLARKAIWLLLDGF